MKIIFMGSPEFAIPTLHKLINSEHQVTAVFTQKPKPKDRGMKEKKSPVHELADAHNIPVYTPITLRNNEVTDLVRSIEADIIIVVAYGFIIPKAILEAKKYGCLNLHPSALPRFRGAAPLQRTIIAGDKETEICIMQMDEGLDTGDVLLKEKLNLNPRITLTELHDVAADIGAKLMLEVLGDFQNITREPQSKEGLVYAPKLTKAESEINWGDDAFAIDCKIRGMNPWPGVFFKSHAENIKIFEAEYIELDHGKPPGALLDEKLTVACGKDALRIKMLQRPGKNKITALEFIRSCKIKINEIL